MWSTRLPNFCLGAKDPPANNPPPPLPPYLCSAAYVLFYWKFALRTWLQKQLGFSHWLRTRARMQAGKGKVWTGGKNGEWVWWEWVSHSWRSTWCTSFLPLVLPWILFMVWLFFSLFISLAKVLNLHCYFPSIAGSLSSFSSFKSVVYWLFFFLIFLSSCRRTDSSFSWIVGDLWLFLNDRHYCLFLQEPLILEVKGLKIGVLGYCDSPSANELNCTELRRQYNVGPAVYSDAIATKDVSNLKKVVSLLCL